MQLFLWECRRVAKSVVYWLYAAALVLFLWGQDALPVNEGLSAFVPPQPGDELNTLVPSGDEARIMPEAAAALRAAWQEDRFVTYPPPLCIYRSVRPSDAQHAALGEVLDALCAPDGTLRPGVTWEAFTAGMEKADRILGGGSDWAPAGLEQKYGLVPATYADLVAEYEACMAHDRYTGAFARLFCDYAVIALALFGALPAVALFRQDVGAGRGGAAAIWVRRVPGAALVGARCAALLALEFLPVLVMDIGLTAYYAGLYGWRSIAPGAFFGYSALWLLPTLALEIAGGAALTLATGTAAGAALWPALGWLCAASGAGGLSNGSTYANLLTPRHNAVGGYLVFRRGLARLLAGRAAALALAGVLLAAAVWALRCRRRGVAVWRSGI